MSAKLIIVKIKFELFILGKKLNYHAVATSVYWQLLHLTETSNELKTNAIALDGTSTIHWCLIYEYSYNHNEVSFW